MSEKDDRDKRASRDISILTSNEDIDPILTLMEEGLKKYISSIVTELLHINYVGSNYSDHQRQQTPQHELEHQRPRHVRARKKPPPERDDLRAAEPVQAGRKARDGGAEEEREQDPEQRPEAGPGRRQSFAAAGQRLERNSAAEEEEACVRRCSLCGPQYTEIYRILLKNKQEKLKENDNKDKNAEDQKKCIQIFAQEGSGFNQRSNQENSYQRAEVFNEVCTAHASAKRTSPTASR